MAERLVLVGFTRGGAQRRKARSEALLEPRQAKDVHEAYGDRKRDALEALDQPMNPLGLPLIR